MRPSAPQNNKIVYRKAKIVTVLLKVALHILFIPSSLPPILDYRPLSPPTKYFLFTLRLCLYTLSFQPRIMALRSTRASIQAGQSNNATLRLREISSAITMIILVVIYLFVDIPTVIMLNVMLIDNYLVPSLAAGTGIIFDIEHFVQVCSSLICSMKIEFTIQYNTIQYDYRHTRTLFYTLH